MIEITLPDSSKRTVVLTNTDGFAQRDQLWQLLDEMRDTTAVIKIFLTDGLPLSLPALTLVMFVRETDTLPVSPDSTICTAFEGKVKYGLHPRPEHQYEKMMPEI